MPERSLVSGSPPSNPEQYFSQTGNNSLYDKDKDNHILLSTDEKNRLAGRARDLELISRFGKIVNRTSAIVDVLKHFYRVGCSFPMDVKKQLNVTESTAYRIVDRLVDAGFIVRLTKVDVPNRAGRKTVVFGLHDVTEKEISDAIIRNMQYSNKSFKFVELLYQRTLLEVFDEEIQWSKIVSLSKAKGRNIQGFHYLDIARHVEILHKRHGVKVWR